MSAYVKENDGKFCFLTLILTSHNCCIMLLKNKFAVTPVFP
jgi:hypothetical protein